MNSLDDQNGMEWNGMGEIQNSHSAKARGTSTRTQTDFERFLTYLESPMVALARYQHLLVEICNLFLNVTSGTIDLYFHMSKCQR